MSKKEPTMQEMIEDFKQYVDVSVGNTVNNAIKESEKRLKNEIVSDLKEEIQELRQEMRQGFEGVGDAFQGSQDQLDDHERRITGLEAAA